MLPASLALGMALPLVMEMAGPSGRESAGPPDRPRPRRQHARRHRGAPASRRSSWDRFWACGGAWSSSAASWSWPAPVRGSPAPKSAHRRWPPRLSGAAAPAGGPAAGPGPSRRGRKARLRPRRHPRHDGGPRRRPTTGGSPSTTPTSWAGRPPADEERWQAHLPAAAPSLPAPRGVPGAGNGDHGRRRAAPSGRSHRRPGDRAGGRDRRPHRTSPT